MGMCERQDGGARGLGLGLPTSQRFFAVEDVFANYLPTIGTLALLPPEAQTTASGS